MKRVTILSIFILFTVWKSFAGEELRIMEGMVMPSRILDQDVHFSVCLPANYYQSDQTFPAVYLLHGLGDDESSWLEYGRISQFADEEVNNGEILPMIFIMPEGFRTYYVNDYLSSFLYQDMFVKELVPFIDSMFRTIPNKQHRAVMGYSMGGFGAFILHLNHPDIFGAAVPLSTSIRTDEQYMSEDASGWDEQWGRLFGAPGLKGVDRITEYYKQNNPFYIFSEMEKDNISDYSFYMDNGDKEQTLCRSNEELHILMTDKNIPHEYRVRAGGHSFSYWCSSLPNALHFISDFFEEKPYRGDEIQFLQSLTLLDIQKQSVLFNNEEIAVFTTKEYDKTNRFYPVIYFIGDFKSQQRETIAKTINYDIENNNIAPVLLVFIPEITEGGLELTIQDLEEKIRIRKGYRFRAIIGYQNESFEVFDLALNKIKFSSCVLTDVSLTDENVLHLLSSFEQDDYKTSRLFIDAPDKGGYYRENGQIHMVLRDLNIKHEYRVREGAGGFNWFLKGIDEITFFITNSFHK